MVHTPAAPTVFFCPIREQSIFDRRLLEFSTIFSISHSTCSGQTLLPFLQHPQGRFRSVYVCLVWSCLVSANKRCSGGLVDAISPPSSPYPLRSLPRSHASPRPSTLKLFASSFQKSQSLIADRRPKFCQKKNKGGSVRNLPTATPPPSLSQRKPPTPPLLKHTHTTTTTTTCPYIPCLHPPLLPSGSSSPSPPPLRSPQTQPRMMMMTNT